MIDMVVKSFISKIKEDMKEYFSIYPFYMNSVDNVLNLYGRELYLYKHFSNLNINSKSNVLMAYERSSLKYNQNMRKRQNPPYLVLDSTDKLTASLNEFVFGEIELSANFYSQDILDIEVIENFFSIKYLPGMVFTIKIKSDDMSKPIEIKYVVDIESMSDRIELISLKEMGSFWNYGLTFTIKGAYMSIENVLYPKIKDVYMNVFATYNINNIDNISPDMKSHTEYIYNDVGDVVGINFNIE